MSPSLITVLCLEFDGCQSCLLATELGSGIQTYIVESSKDYYWAIDCSRFLGGIKYSLLHQLDGKLQWLQATTTFDKHIMPNARRVVARKNDGHRRKKSLNGKIFSVNKTHNTCHVAVNSPFKRNSCPSYVIVLCCCPAF